MYYLWRLGLYSTFFSKSSIYLGFVSTCKNTLNVDVHYSGEKMKGLYKHTIKFQDFIKSQT
jgi:hypothetical protein